MSPWTGFLTQMSVVVALEPHEAGIELSTGSRAVMIVLLPMQLQEQEHTLTFKNLAHHVNIRETPMLTPPAACTFDSSSWW